MSDELPDSSEQNPPPHKPDGWELFCSGILRTQFGRRPSRVVNKAMMQLAAEEALSGPPVRQPVSWGERMQGWLSGLWTQPIRPALAGFALIMVIVVCAFVFGRGIISGREQASTLCILTDASGAHWALNSTHPRVGDALSKRQFHLESGVVELTFATTAKVAVQGPAIFTVMGPNTMELQSGRASTLVPKRAHGFSLHLPAANVVDLGTRFGAIVGGDKSSEVEVFQGKVKLTAYADKEHPAQLTQGMAMRVDQQGATTTTTLSEAAFPQPNLSTLARPQNCGFDVTNRVAVGGVPVGFGYWSGPAYVLTGATSEIRPANGPSMLRFLDNATRPDADSEVWQLVDMAPFKGMLAGGNAEADLSALFNRIHSDGKTGKKFGLTLAAFHGPPSQAKILWETRATTALALVDKELAADDEPATWEKLALTARLPAETDFVIVELRAIAPSDASAGAPVFPGNYADLVDLEIHTPVLASSINNGR